MSLVLAAVLLAGAGSPASDVPTSSSSVPSAAAPRRAAAEMLSGRVTTPEGAPIARARVVVSELNRSANTDDDGHYHIASLPDGRYLVSVTAIGFKPHAEQVTLAGKDVTFNVTLEKSLVELPSIQVTATADASAATSSPQSTAVLGGDALRTARGTTLGETLEGLAGVRSLSTGAGIGKPVIRGLTNNQIAILANGQRLESQQWGYEHGPSVETADVERIEVIRGPGSVLYGTDAIGGVINVIPRDLPDASGGKPVFGGSLSGVYGSNNRAPEGTAVVEGGFGAVGFRSSFTARTAGDIRAPNTGDPRGGELFNSGLRTLGGETSVGVHGTWGSLTATGAYRDERLRIHDEDPTATPFQRIGDTRAKVEAILPSGSTRWELMAGYQRNTRREFADSAFPNDVALGFRETNWQAHAHYHHKPIGRLTGVVGIAGTYGLVNLIPGEESIVPNSRNWNAGLFAFETLEAGRATFTFGARYDHRGLTRRVTPELGFTGEDRRSYNALTGSVGLVYRTSSATSIVVNAGSGFRAPTPFQLYVNGVHEGTGFYEIGDSTLTTEKSFNGDVALRVQSHGVNLELGAFANFIRDYIYIAPTGATYTDPASGQQSPVYLTQQGNARLTGFEFAMDAHPTEWLELKGTTDYTRGTNTAVGGPLPFIAPLRATYSATLRGRDRGALQRPYLTVGGESNLKQDRVVAFDTPTAGYTVANLAVGFALPTPRGLARVDLQLHNVFDTAFTPFLWRYKTYAYFMGRNLTTRVSLDL